MADHQQVVVDRLDCLLSKVDNLAARVDQLQVQVHLNSDVLNQVVSDQHVLAEQMDATGKAVAKLTLEQMDE